MTKRKKNKKKLIITISVIVAIILGAIISYVVLLSPISKKSEEVVVVIKPGDGKKEVVDILKNAKLIKSKYATLAYIILNGNKNIQAGNYELNRNMSVEDIITNLNVGNIIKEERPTVSITFKEGTTLKSYLELISKETNLEYDKIIKEVNDKSMLNKFIEKYWFLKEDILDDEIYYALEGYLYPNTYEFYKETTLEAVLTKMLDNTNKMLDGIKDKILDSKYSVHDILTMASIVEKEAVKNDDRKKVAQVIYTRLKKNMSLGMDVTSYYGAQKDMSEAISSSELNDNNPYNTRPTTFIGLPIGPICNPSKNSIEAVLTPASTNYVYFIADIKTGDVYFTDKYEEFLKLKRKFG